MTGQGEQLRRRLDHPVIDSDGHVIEFLPSVLDRLRSLGGDDVVAGFQQMLDGTEHFRAIDEKNRRALGVFRPPWWAFPARNTRDRATAVLPKLMRERLDSLGIDFAVIYPTLGLFSLSAEPEDLRRACTRAFNEFYAEAYREHRDRLCPAALIPMNTPEEAIDELEYSVNTLGLRVVVLAGHVLRPLPGDDMPRAARWVDSFGLDSLHDYDPVWEKCEQLRVSPTFHSSGMGWGSRTCVSNYVFNHLGNFAAAGEATCRSLFMTGVARRFPNLRFAFLEGGVAWACNLYSDLIGHFEKRNRNAIGSYDPAELDRKHFAELFDRYASKEFLERRDQIDTALRMLSNPDEDRAHIDEFAASGIESAEDIRTVFEGSFSFGCEADDPMNALAFDRKLNPLGARMNAIFGSDIGHWDVTDIDGVLSEAYELVEKGIFSESDFRAFVCDNPRKLWCESNPDFFAGTILES